MAAVPCSVGALRPDEDVSKTRCVSMHCVEGRAQSVLTLSCSQTSKIEVKYK